MDIENAIKTITSWYEIENDGIGAYEFWGSKYIDNRPDYVNGGIEILFPEIDYNKENSNELIDEFQDSDYIRDIISDEFFGDNIDIQNVCVESNKGKACLMIEYQAEVPELEYEEND